MKILITGIAGSGKTTIINELSKRGYHTLDLDTCNICFWINKQTGKVGEYASGVGKEWIQEHRWQVDLHKLKEKLDKFDTKKEVFVGGKVSKTQADDIRQIFDIIYLISPDDSVVHERLYNRISNANEFAKSKEEAEWITSNRSDFEERYLKVGAMQVKNNGSVEEVVNFIIRN